MTAASAREEDGITRPQVLLAWGLVLLVALIVFAPLIRSGFFVVTFDDDAFVIDNPWIRTLSWASLCAWLGSFYHADYVPVTLASFALDYRLWGLWPGGYHLTNIALHLCASSLVVLLVTRATARVETGLIAGTLFALHPLQLEAVAIISQRKTLLATTFALLALLAYHRHLTQKGRAAYMMALGCFALGCLAKSSIVPLPFLLALCDWRLVGRVRVWDKLPFLLIAGVATWLSIASKVGIGVVKAPHGGSRLVTSLLMGRVWVEYLASFFLPFELSPAYYYSPSLAYSPWHAAALASIAGLHIGLWVWRRRFPLSTFALFWFTIAMLPVANIVPIAVVRGNRYLYLALVGLVWWTAHGLVRIRPPQPLRVLRPVAVYALMIPLGVLTAREVPTWRDDVTIWSRVVELHPWNARASYLLGQAYANVEDLAAAEQILLRSSNLDPQFALPHRLLADVFVRMGDIGRARAQLQQSLTLAPHEPVPESLRWVLEAPAR